MIAQRVLFALLCVCLSVAVLGAEPGNIFGIKFPQTIEEMFEVAHEDPEAGVTFKKSYGSFFLQQIQRYDDFGLGYALHYSSVAGMNISVYVYSLGLNDIPDGADSKAISDELASSGQEIAASGQYVRVEQYLNTTGLSPHFAQASYRLSSSDGRIFNSYTLLRGHNGFFIKLRVSGPERPMENRIAEFLESFEKDLGLDGKSPGNASKSE